MSRGRRRARPYRTMEQRAGLIVPPVALAVVVSTLSFAFFAGGSRLPAPDTAANAANVTRNQPVQPAEAGGKRLGDDMTHPRRAMRAAKRAETAVFTVISMNVLGAGHTGAHGNKRGYATGPTRMRQLLPHLAKWDPSVIGFQEFQTSQYAVFHSERPQWQVYPGPVGRGQSYVRNSIAWDTNVWDVIQTETTPVPYFYGKPLPMPVVLLRHKASGAKVWFMNFHNPGDSRGNAAGHRANAIIKESAKVNELQESAPVIFTGDLNDREIAYCGLTTRTELQAAQGGGSSGSPCTPPGGRMPVDWVFGTKDIGFSNYQRYQPKEMLKLTDHPMIVATATVESYLPPDVSGRKHHRKKAG